MSDEAVCRTAPATPGLLNTSSKSETKADPVAFLIRNIFVDIHNHYSGEKEERNRSSAMTFICFQKTLKEI